MTKRTSFAVFLILFGYLFSLAQTDTFLYQRQITGVNQEWHEMDVPMDVLSRVKNNLGDIRIFGINNQGDTLGVPYLIAINVPEQHKESVPVDVLNRSSKTGTYFFTLKPTKLQSLNKIDLFFANSNFDWKVKLEGSQDNSEWFSILDDYRILSIQNSETNYQFTTLSFSTSEYTYYRISIPSEDVPVLKKATISLYQNHTTSLNQYPIRSIENQETKHKKSILEISLKEKYPVSSVQLLTKATIDFVRPITISALVDSFKTDKGWKYNYRNVYNGTFSTWESGEFTFSPFKTSKLRVTIENGDNAAIDIDVSYVRGYKHTITARFNSPSYNYQFVYGNAYVGIPDYDISLFRDRIPTSLNTVELGPIEYKKIAPPTEPKEESKLWLWVIMGVVILVLGVFTLKMMKNS
ncbi:MAG: hypothetical protein COA58_00030 [Bacteroidetes bacterium]|nr:MAG: hypothetical protein COA58_00030 [Bacteroidota bacterium]